MKMSNEDYVYAMTFNDKFREECCPVCNERITDENKSITLKPVPIREQGIVDCCENCVDK